MYREGESSLARIFISYRHVERDSRFAQHLAARLEQRGHAVFLDTALLVGTRWVEEIESQLRRCHFFIPLLSPDSILSDMVRREVELARALDSAGSLRILPVRFDLDGDLPYDLAAYLNPIQYLKIATEADFDHATSQLLRAVEHFQALPEGGAATDTPAAACTAESCGAPLPAADLRVETGAIAGDSPFYVRRSCDEIVERALQQAGSTVVISGPRQSGKSSLLARACTLAGRTGAPVCYLDFQLFDNAQLQSLESLLKYVAWKIGRAVAARSKPEPWDPILGHKEMLTSYVEDAVLSESNSHLVFAFDEVDRVFDYPYRDDFFGLIRAWHNRRATQAGWRRVSMLLAHSTDPALWIQDVNQSPFNVGEHAAVEDFDIAQATDLARRYGLDLGADAAHRLRLLVGGQPFLVRQALYAMARHGMGIDQLAAGACDERGPFGDHLRQFRWRLHRNPRLSEALRQILDARRCDHEEDFLRLKAAGLIRGQTCHRAELRCEIYERYFRGQLGTRAAGN